MTTYVARAVRRGQGWDLLIDGVGATRVATLDEASDQVRSYVEERARAEVGSARIVITLDYDEFAPESRAEHSQHRQTV